MATFPDRARELRGKKSLKTMESFVGIPAATIERIEKGATEAKVGHLVAYRRSCGVTADYLLGLSDDPSPTGQGSNTATNSPGAAVGTGASVRTVPQPPAAAPWQCRDCPTVAALREAVAALSRAAVSPQ